MNPRELAVLIAVAVVSCVIVISIIIFAIVRSCKKNEEDKNGQVNREEGKATGKQQYHSNV